MKQFGVFLPFKKTQNNARGCKTIAKMQIYPQFAQNNARRRRNSLFFSEKIGRAAYRRVNQGRPQIKATRVESTCPKIEGSDKRVKALYIPPS